MNRWHSKCWKNAIKLPWVLLIQDCIETLKSALCGSKSKYLHFCIQSSKKDNASEGAGDTGGSEKADAEGSSDEDEGALVIDEKNERGGTKRKAEESTEVSFTCQVL